jgi:ankyrin repeat protein
VNDDPHADFIGAACVPLDSGHASSTLDRAAAILAAHPKVAQASIHAAAILGDDATVRRFLELDPASATAKGGPRGWDPLTHLCFSRYLRLDPARSEGFVRAAEALLDAGASANSGFHSGDEWESAIYGAAGVAHHAALTRVLLDHGADPNDEETPYHVPESYDNDALKVIVESGKLTEDNLAAMLLRKHDWHDYDGAQFLLERSADPNRMTRWGYTALHQAVRRDNHIAIIELLLDHGADPTLLANGRSAVAMAARRGRGDLLELFERRGVSVELQGADRLIAACARDDAAAVRSIAAREPGLVDEVLHDGGRLLAEFAGVGNADSVGHLLDLGVPVDALFAGEGYWDVAANSTALHVAAWRANHATVKLLIDRGAPVNALDGKGQSPLALAVRACVDSYWSGRRSPDSVRALLEAGASASGVAFPSGYAEVDELLRGT